MLKRIRRKTSTIKEFIANKALIINTIFLVIIIFIWILNSENQVSFNLSLSLTIVFSFTITLNFNIKIFVAVTKVDYVKIINELEKGMSNLYLFGKNIGFGKVSFQFDYFDNLEVLSEYLLISVFAKGDSALSESINKLRNQIEMFIESLAIKTIVDSNNPLYLIFKSEKDALEMKRIADKISVEYRNLSTIINEKLAPIKQYNKKNE